MRAVAAPVLLRAQLSGSSGHQLYADMSQHPFSSDPSFSSFPRPLSQVAGSLYLSHGRPALEQVTGGGAGGWGLCSWGLGPVPQQREADIRAGDRVGKIPASGRGR